MEKKKRRMVFVADVARELVNRGFDCYGYSPQKFNPKYNVFFFEESESIRKAITDITGKECKPFE